MPSPNQRISEYVLLEKIGGGTFGEVWKAQHHVWHDQLVAIKIPTDPQYVRNLQHEGAAIHGLHHTNIVRAIGFDPYADPAYLIVAPCGFDLERSLREVAVLERLPRWFELSAVQNGHVAFADGNKYFNRSGITIVETVEILAEILHRDCMSSRWHERAWSCYTPTRSC